MAEPFPSPRGDIQTVYKRLLRIGYQEAPRPLVPSESVEERRIYPMDMIRSQGGTEHPRVQGGGQRYRLGDLPNDAVQMERADKRYVGPVP